MTTAIMCSRSRVATTFFPRVRDQQWPKRAGKCDATQIYQVIVNLATNAPHAIGDKAGVVEVRLDAPNIREHEVALYSKFVPALRAATRERQWLRHGCGYRRTHL